MHTVAIGLAVGIFVWVMGSVFADFRKLPGAKLTVKITDFVFQLLVGIGLAGSAIAVSVSNGTTNPAVIAPATFSTLMTSRFL